MIKLFTKNFSYSFSAMVAFCAIACTSDNPNFVGTAEEPNQFAYGNGESSSTNIESSTSIADSSKEQNLYLPNSSSSKRSQHMSSSRNPQPKSASSVPASSNASVPSPHEGNFGHAGADPFREQTLDYYLQRYKVPGETFDENVLAYNVTYKSCDLSQNSCNEVPDLPPFASNGLHKITDDNLANAISIYSITSKFMGGTLASSDGCPLYVLNINETSPAVHILTKITKDTLTVATFYDNCDYERRPFDMYVGFLFSYCGELSEKPEIVITSTLNEAMTPCGSVDYKEYISKKILPAATTISPIQD